MLLNIKYFWDVLCVLTREYFLFYWERFKRSKTSFKKLYKWFYEWSQYCSVYQVYWWRKSKGRRSSYAYIYFCVVFVFHFFFNTSLFSFPYDTRIRTHVQTCIERREKNRDNTPIQRWIVSPHEQIQNRKDLES